MPTAKKLELPHCLDRERFLESIFKVLGRKIIFYVCILSLLRKLAMSFLSMTDSH